MATSATEKNKSTECERGGVGRGGETSCVASLGAESSWQRSSKCKGPGVAEGPSWLEGGGLGEGRVWEVQSPLVGRGKGFGFSCEWDWSHMCM